MSNEVAVVHGHLIPAYLLGRTEPIKSDLGRAGGPPRIAIMKDGFKIMQDGRDVKLPAPLPVIILGASPAGEFYNRAYYIHPYQPGSLEPPDCASSDGIIPDSGDIKQATACAQCPWSQWGSDPRSGRGQACAQGKTLLVVPASAPTGAVFQLRVPPTSLKPVAAYGAEIAAYGVPISAVITHLGIELEGDTQYQKLTLGMGGFLREDAGPVAIARSESVEIRALVTVVDPSKQIAAAQAPPVQPLPVQPLPVQQAPQFAPVQPLPVQPLPVEQAPQFAPVQPPPVQQDAGWGAPPPQAPPQSTEWGAPPVQQPPVQQPPVQQPPVQQPPNAELDSAGEPWDSEKHSSGKTVIKDGTWKKKKGYVPPPPQTQQAPPQTQQAPPQTQTGGLDDILAQWG